jgi:uncharacterized protein
MKHLGSKQDKLPILRVAPPLLPARQHKHLTVQVALPIQALEVAKSSQKNSHAIFRRCFFRCYYFSLSTDSTRPSPLIALHAIFMSDKTWDVPVPPSCSSTLANANPCLDCGACCAHFRVSFYCGEVAGENSGTVPLELVTQLSPVRVCMKGTEQGHNRCTSLRGQLGQPGIHCAIYPQRPTPCREFETWLPDGSPNPDCQRLRANLGLPALLPQRIASNDPTAPREPDQPRAA